MLKFTEESIKKLENKINDSLSEQRDNPGLIDCTTAIFEDTFHDGRRFQIQIKVTSDDRDMFDINNVMADFLENK